MVCKLKYVGNDKAKCIENRSCNNGFLGNIDGTLYVSKYIRSDPQLFSGYISSLVVSTLTHEKSRQMGSDALNTELGIATTDPLSWLKKYKKTPSIERIQKFKIQNIFAKTNQAQSALKCGFLETDNLLTGPQRKKKKK
jgi:hypothetical protein